MQDTDIEKKDKDELAASEQSLSENLLINKVSDNIAPK